MSVLNFLVPCGWCGKMHVPSRNFLRRVRAGKKPYCSQAHAMRDTGFIRERKKKMA